MKILLIVEKPYCHHLIEDVITTHQHELPKENTYYFAQITPTHHINDQFLRFRKDENFQIYQQRKKIEEANWLKLNNIEIPLGTYFEINNFIEKINPNDYDLIIGCPDNDTNGILALQKLCERNNIENIKFYGFISLTDSEILKLLKLENLQDFNDVFLSCYEKMKNNNFSADYPRENDVELLRKATRFNRKEFSDYFKIPYRTVENWEFLENDCPKYLFDLMVYKLKNEKIL